MSMLLAIIHEILYKLMPIFRKKYDIFLLKILLIFIFLKCCATNFTLLLHFRIFKNIKFVLILKCNLILILLTVLQL